MNDGGFRGFELHGKTAVVTGGASGIGAGIAATLALAGATALLVGAGLGAGVAGPTAPTLAQALALAASGVELGAVAVLVGRRGRSPAPVA